MDGLAEALQGILGSEEGQKQIKAVADMLGLSGEEQPAPSAPPPALPENILPGNLPAPGELLKIAELLKSVNNDNPNTLFLRSLKPLLKPERQPKVDQAIRIMRLFALIPLIKENDWIKDLLGDFLK